MPKPRCLYNNTILKDSAKQQHHKARKRLSKGMSIMITGHTLNHTMPNQVESKKYLQIYFGRKRFTVFMLKFIDTKNIAHATSEPIIDAWYGSTNRS